MKKKFKLGVIGSGFMSRAIISGVIGSKILEESDICVSDKFEEALSVYSNTSVTATTDNSFVVENSEFVLFAVKPQSLDEVLATLNGCRPEKVISIMAGVKKEKFKNRFAQLKVARCMPNTPCSLGCGAIGADLTDFTDEQDKNFIKTILSSLGVVVEVKEELLNVVTGISGSSPAYFYLFIKSLVESGVKHGLNYEDAENLAVATMIGSGKMIMKNKDKTLDELIKAVCSKGGTTIEAVKVFENDGLGDTVQKAVDACVKRSKELENL